MDYTSPIDPGLDALLRDRDLTAPAKLAYLRLYERNEWRPAQSSSR